MPVGNSGHVHLLFATDTLLECVFLYYVSKSFQSLLMLFDCTSSHSWGMLGGQNQRCLLLNTTSERSQFDIEMATEMMPYDKDRVLRVIPNSAGTEPWL